MFKITLIIVLIVEEETEAAVHNKVMDQVVSQMKYFVLYICIYYNYTFYTNITYT